MLAKKDAAPPTMATSTRRPKNSEIVPKANRGNRIAIEMAVMVEWMGAAVHLMAGRRESDTRSGS